MKQTTQKFVLLLALIVLGILPAAFEAKAFHEGEREKVFIIGKVSDVRALFCNRSEQIEEIISALNEGGMNALNKQVDRENEKEKDACGQVIFRVKIISGASKKVIQFGEEPQENVSIVEALVYAVYIETGMRSVPPISQYFFTSYDVVTEEEYDLHKRYTTL